MGIGGHSLVVAVEFAMTSVLTLDQGAAGRVHAARILSSSLCRCAPSHLHGRQRAVPRQGAG